MMQWDGKVGPSFIVVLALAGMQGLIWITDSKAGIDRRVAIIESTLSYLSPRIERIEQKIDNLKR